MAIPLLLVGAAALIGAGSITSAVADSYNASKLRDDAEAKLEEARKKLEAAAERTNYSLAGLGREKLRVCSTYLQRVVAIADRVHVGENNMRQAQVRAFEVTPEDVAEMRKASIGAVDLLSAGASGLTTGALASMGAMGLATTFGTASTGAAISGLSGAAASNAALAWLGGGSIAAGGGGVAAGTALVTGLFAAPAIAIAGIALAIQADKNLTAAQEHAAEVDVACEKIDVAILRARAVDARAEQVKLAIKELAWRLHPRVVAAENMLARKPAGKVPFASLGAEEQNLYKTVLMLGGALYELVEVDIIDELGEVTEDSSDSIARSQEAMAQAASNDPEKKETA